MRLALPAVAVMALALTPLAKADTIDFTATVTQYHGLSAVAIGSTYTGFVHYDGSVDPNFTGVPPTLTSYGFNYPSAPASISGLFDAFVQRHQIGDPLFVGLAYVDFSGPAASFDIIANIFTIFTPTSENARGYGYSNYESGTVAYSYVKDPIGPTSAAPEPSSLALLGTGLIGAVTLVRRRLVQS